MRACEAAARKAFEAEYTIDPHIWLVKNADGSYRYTEMQDAWTEFFRGWNAGFAWNPDKES